MDWITTVTNAITQLAVITKERLLMLVVLGLFVYGFYVQHNTVVEERAARKAQEDKCSELVAKIREDNRISYNEQTLLFQNQINEFVVNKNKENDSIYNYFFTLIRKYNIKVSKINNELDKIKQNESIN
jgi:hypothetical protein